MKKAYQLFYLLILLSVPFFSWSQAKLTIDSMWSNPIDTVEYLNNSPIIKYTMIIKNVGNNKLDGACSMRVKYNQDTVEYDRKNWQAVNFEVGQTDTITFNDTIFNLNSNRYKGGDNIIVIWPHTDNPSIQAPDTTQFGIYVDISNASTKAVDVLTRVEIWPNPTNGNINIEYLRAAHNVEGVRILGIDGKLLEEYHSAIQSLDLSRFSKGIYLIEFRFKDGLRAAYRLSKTN